MPRALTSGALSERRFAFSLALARWGELTARLTRPWRRPLYRLYERRLAEQVLARPLPQHIALVLDGNRRHARKHGLTDPREIYDRGAEKLDDVLAWCRELGIGAMTLWVCSPENLARSSLEVSGILGALEAKIEALAGDPRLHRHEVRVRAVGRLELLPRSTLDVLTAAQQATAAFDR